VTGPRIAATVASLLALAAVAAALLGWPSPAARPGTCAALDELSRALTLDSWGDQAAVRSRAAELADRVDREQAPVAEEVRLLLANPGATVEQLVAALEPVAEQCDIRLQLGNREAD
jgi:hypothetical protein